MRPHFHEITIKPFGDFFGNGCYCFNLLLQRIFSHEPFILNEAKSIHRLTINMNDNKVLGMEELIAKERFWKSGYDCFR